MDAKTGRCSMEIKLRTWKEKSKRSLFLQNYGLYETELRSPRVSDNGISNGRKVCESFDHTFLPWKIPRTPILNVAVLGISRRRAPTPYGALDSVCPIDGVLGFQKLAFRTVVRHGKWLATPDSREVFRCCPTFTDFSETLLCLGKS